MVCTTLRWRELDSNFRFLDLVEHFLHRSGAWSRKGPGSHSRLLTTDLVQRRRDKQAAKRLLRKLLDKQMRPPRVMHGSPKPMLYPSNFEHD